MRSLLVRFVLFVGFAALAASASAQDDSRGALRPGEERRVALVIGNGDYQVANPLPNPPNDAQAIADKLREIGFEVFLGLDLTRDDLNALLQQYTRALDGADVGLFFYAGHGLQVDGINYIVPVDAVLERAADLDFEVVDSNIVLRQFDRPNFTGLVFLDACRDNPLARSMSTGTRSIGRGLAEVTSATGTLIAYATQPGNVAYDGEGEHSPFTQALLDHIDTPDMEIRLMLDYVGEEVAEMTNGQQQPWVHFSRLRGGFYFVPKAETDEPGTDLNGTDVAVNENDPAVLLYNSAQTLESPEARLLMLEQFIRLYPTHPLATLAATEVQELRTRAANPNPDRIDPNGGQPNHPPVVEAARTLTVDADAGLTALGIGTPEDEDGDQLTVTVIELPEAGAVQSVGVAVAVNDVLTPGELTGLDYLPDEAREGAVGELRYRVDDGNGGLTEGVLRIALRAPNRPPVVQDATTVSIDIAADPVPLGITAPIDPDNDRLQIRVTWLPRYGAVELNGRPIQRDDELTAYQLIALSYRTDPERTGDMGSFEYQVDDGRGGLVRAAMRINVLRPNTPPAVADELLVEVEADPAGVPLGLTPPTDPDGDVLTIRVTWLPRWGSLMSGSTLIERGAEMSTSEFAALRYIAAAGHDGDAGSFEFAVSDGRGDPVRGMVRISVIAPNRPPEVVAEQSVTVVAENGAAQLVFKLPADPDGDAIEVTVTEIPYRGRLVSAGRTVRVGTVLDGNALTALTYEPAPGHSGEAGQFAFTVTDGNSAPQAGLIRISVESTNRAPVVADAQTVTVRSGAVTPLGIPAPTDPDGDTLSVRIVEVPNGGFLRSGSSVVRPGQSIGVDALTQIAFEMTGNELRSNLLSYEVSDGRGGVATGSVALEIEEVQVISAGPDGDLAGDSLVTAYDGGVLDGRSIVFEDRIAAGDVADYYRVSVADWSEITVAMTGLAADLDIYLYTADERNVAASELVGEVDETLVANVPAGIYFVAVLPFEEAQSEYTLTVSAGPGAPPPADQVGDNAQTADLLGTPGQSPINVGEQLNIVDIEDWYGFDVADFVEVSAVLSGLSGDLDLDLIDSAGTVLASSAAGGYEDESVVAQIGPGRYFLRVYLYSGQSDYGLSLSAVPSAPPPPDGAGNTADEAFPLGTVDGTVSFGDWIGTADTNDYIAFNLNQPGTLTVRMTGLAADADLELLNPAGELVGSSNNVELADEEIVVDVGAGAYYARVYPYQGQTDYRLEISLRAGGSTGPNIGNGPVETVEQLRVWEDGWSRDEKRQVQRGLQMLGYYTSAIDGLFGNGTRSAIRAFQQGIGEAPTGYLSRQQRVRLSVDAAEEAQARAESAAGQARSAAEAPGAFVDPYQSGDVYRGDTNRVGYGVYQWASGHRYEGQWDRSRSGFGVLILQDGWRYGGQWVDSSFVGFGVAIGPNGERIVGEWNIAPETPFSEGLNGYGQVIAPDGSVQTGYFVAGQLANFN
ncbi:MAG: Ig-like domain-containing protein [Alphaproteobacteria bacterium]